MILTKTTDVGSVWRKWDFHIHTPESFQWEGQKFHGMTQSELDNACRSLVERLNEADATVFVIMDYWTFDGYLKLKSYLRNNRSVRLEKVIFPGIELRCDAPTDKRLNIHAIISNTLDDQYLIDFKAKLQVLGVNRSLSDSALIDAARQLAADKLRPHGYRLDQLNSEEVALEIGRKTALITRESFFDALDVLPDNHGFVFMPFDTYGGFHTTVNIMAHPHITTEFMKRSHIFESRKRESISCFNGIATQKNSHFLEDFMRTIGGYPKPAVSGSDAHHFSRYADFPSDSHGQPRATWIKAEPTIEGLVQLLNEPVGRVFVGSEPEKLAIVRAHPTKYLTSLKISKKETSDFTERWFEDVVLEFNHDLVSIIGNKGSGKSALADILGLLGNSQNNRHFSFLNGERFCNKSLNKSKHFRATLTWASGETVSRSLDEVIDPTEVERVRYLPQNHLEAVCNEIKHRKGEGFDAELKSVIFSHVPKSERLGFSTLDELLEYKTKQTNNSILIHKANIHELNCSIVALEKRSTEEHRKTLANLLEAKLEQVRAHDEVKPHPVPEPTIDPAIVSESASIGQEMERTRSQVAQIDVEIGILNQETEKHVLLEARLADLLGQIDNFQRIADEFQQNLTLGLNELSISVSNVFTYFLSRTPLENRLALHQTEIINLIRKLDDDQYDSLPNLKTHLLALLEQQQSKLEGPERLYQEYRSNLASWEVEQRRLRGDVQTPGSLNHLKHELMQLKDLPDQILSLKEKRRAKAHEILQAVLDLADVYRTVYKPVQDFASNHELINKRFGLNFSVEVRPDTSLPDRFFTLIHRGMSGSFYGNDEGDQMLREIIGKYTFSKADEAIAFADDLVEHISQDHRGSNMAMIPVDKQLKKGRTVEELYDYIYSFDYLKPNFTLNLGDKELSQLSPGERGMLLLVFYLLIDKDDIPLIVDQPEGNLDNQTVFNLLGGCIKEAKKRRQIIVVTHNPNLAVACDSEQIICANFDSKNDNLITYRSGAIENPSINKSIVDVLEGTRPAFDNRGQKYF